MPRGYAQLGARMLTVAMFLPITGLTNLVAAEEGPREAVIKIVAQIRKADYEGDRKELKRLYEELATSIGNKELAPRVHYWRGFAMWRRAINGFNDAVDPKELEQDLRQAVDEFKQIAAKEPGFVDAKAGEGSCLLNILYLHQSDQKQMRELLGRAMPLLKEAEKAEPENPRLLWVLGANRFATPPAFGGSQSKAIETYKKGLQACAKNRAKTSDPLEPSWGEPELLMNLAWSSLHSTTPDVQQAEQYAQAALKLVPNWHYVRDILVPQIAAAKEKGK